MFYKDRIYTEPCTQENRISYNSFCQLGGVDNPRLAKVSHTHGSLFYMTYHLKRY